MRFALEVRQGRPGAGAFARKLEAHLSEVGSTVVGPGEECDMVLAVGGDGTMLTAVGRSLQLGVPVLGFNLGTMGFLAEADPDAMESVVSRLMSGDYEVQERMTISATVESSHAVGVNDVVVEKIDSQRLVVLEVAVDGADFVTYRADGVIVATPTGSTAYSFSAGGPLMTPGVDALILTPVAAHSLFDQSLVLHPSSEIRITVVSDRAVKVSVDKNDLGRLSNGGVVTVAAGAPAARFVRLEGTSFSQLIKSKFDLG